MYLFVDTETSALPKNYKAPLTDFDNWPRLVQIGYICYDDGGLLLSEEEYLIKPNGFEITQNASDLHGITQLEATTNGRDIGWVLEQFAVEVALAHTIVGHNIDFDTNVLGSEFLRNGYGNILEAKPKICTMKETTNFCKLPHQNKNMPGYKWPKLHELYFALFHEDMGKAHTALQDIRNTAKCFFELKRIGAIR